MSDEEMDARLAAAGQRWREANSVAADVDSVAFGDAPATEDGVPFELPQPARRTGVRRWQWIAGAAALVALVVGLAVGLQRSGRHRGADASADAGRPALLGTSWTLANLTPDGGRTTKALNQARISFAKNGAVAGNDGCANFSSTSAQPSPTITGSAASTNGDAHGTVIFGAVGMAAIGCVDVNLMWQLDLFDKIVMSPEPAAWTIYGSGKLALERDGVGTLVFVQADLDPGFDGGPATGTASPTTSNTDPHLLRGVQWRLGTIIRGNVGASVDWVEGAAPRLAFSADGTVEGYDGCNPVRGTYTVEESTLALDLTVTTATACSSGFAAQVDGVLLSRRVTWKVENNSLSLSSGTTTLDFGASSS